MDDVRQTIAIALEDRGLTLSDLSKRVGRNHAYMQQFMKRFVPERLPEDVRRAVARELGIPESRLGGPDAPRPLEAPAKSVSIPEHDVRASAGGGSIIDAENEIAQWPMPIRYVRDALGLRSPDLAIIEVIGDSMEPTLRSGDKIMIDRGDKEIGNPGVFALYDGSATVVKRIERVLGADLVRVSSDNANHSAYDVPTSVVHIAGRVVWFGRRL